MEVGILCSCCKTSSGIVMASSQSIGSWGASTVMVVVRRNSSSTACWSFSCVLSPSRRVSTSGAWQKQHGEPHERENASFSLLKCNRQLQGGLGLDLWRVYGKSRRFWRGPVVPRSRGGGLRLPGNPAGPEGKPQSSYISPPGLGQFRPPTSAYVPEYEESEEERQNAEIQKRLLLDKLRNGQGSWQERAVFVKELQQLGVTSEDLYSLTFVPIVKQLEIVVAAQVYESLVQSGASEEILQRFDEFNISLLYALRTLSAGQRRSAAEYVMEKSLTIEETQKLAWAIKDHERRPLGRKGFTPAPGDCLAFMYHRQAIESQDKELRQTLVKQGLDVAVTDSAKQRFSEFS